MTFTSYIFGMESKTLQSPEIFPYELKKKIILELSQNVHRYIPLSQPKFARKIMNRISLINKDLYNELKKQRNDPISTRTMIINIAFACNRTESNIAHILCTPGAQKCINLSEKLYSPNLNSLTIKKLFNMGALVNYYQPDEGTVLCYWFLHKAPQSLAIIKMLLILGANPNEEESLINIAINQKSTKKIKLLIKYKAEKPWSLILEQQQKLIDYCIANSTQDELNDGLISCITTKYEPRIMQQFIDKGANPSIGLAPILNEIINMMYITDFNYFSINEVIKNILIPDSNSPFIQKFNFLCDQQGFDEESLFNIQDLQDSFTSMIHMIQHLNRFFDRQVFNETTLSKAEDIQNFLDSLIQKLEKNQKMNTIKL